MLAWANAFNEAALFLQTFGYLSSVKTKARVEVREGNDQDEVQHRIDEGFSGAAGKAAWVWRLEPGDQDVGEGL